MDRSPMDGRGADGLVTSMVLVLAVAVAGCGSSGGGGRTTAPGTSSVPPASSGAATATVGPAAAALAAYTGMWTATAAASRTSDWRSPELARYARDSALQAIAQALLADQERGVTATGAPTLSPRVTDLIPPEAPIEVRILDCGDDSGWLKYTADGRLVDDEPGGRRRITAIVRLDADGWQVTDFAIQGVGSC